MVNFELKRDRILLRWGIEKYEWCLEPRYWRNPFIGVAILLVLPLFFYSYPHLLTMLTTANLLAAIAIPLSLQILGTARVNFGPQFYLGIGGYTAALLNLHLGWNPLFTLAGTIIVCGIFSLLLSPITWIARGLYFSLITLILPLAFLDLTYQFGDIFRGEVGLFGMSPLLDLGRVRWNYLSYYYLSLFLMLFYVLMADKIGRSRFGVSLAAINENEDVARMMGINVSKYKVFYYVLPSILTGVVGWFIVHTFRSFAGITYLPLEFMLKILFIVIIGGRAFVYGAVPGAYAVAMLEEGLRGLGHVSHWIFPLALIALIYILPRGEGLWGLYHKRHPRDYFPKLHVRRE
ncbi:MAG TPA: branched-chain amino acid ABC transporter permease [Desulfobacteraceae bacterium]|nr:branched-chain amino acid ABC transporter permease [Desulfobacteraceae bacterium]